MIRTQLDASVEETQGAIQGPSVIVIESGSGTLKAGNVTIEAKPGVVCLVIAGKELKLSGQSNKACRSYSNTD